MSVPEVLALGDAAVLLRFGPGGEEDARATAERIRIDPPGGLRDVVVAYDALALHFDPLAAGRSEVVAAALRRAAEATVEPVGEGELHTLRVRYDGPDLQDVAVACGLSPDAVVELHAAAEYRVMAVGFVPGFAYLGELDERLRLPRRDAPRPRVPAGSVAIAGAHTAVYPLPTPGGWHLIGRTEAVLFDPLRDPPAPLTVGARVRFVPA